MGRRGAGAKNRSNRSCTKASTGGLRDQIEAHSDYLECFFLFSPPFFVFFVDKNLIIWSNLAVPELDNTDTSLSRM